ncbi:MAG: YbaN family protein [Bradyrhizobium sp.]|uniref:YbaN family protein n=1 Tax=Bradyrhizobium sp. TaxID=376 RepID=UPI0027261AB0|nr:YbaN family protein [Bradyrhizobium sp.]MDO8396185.1 YbaN family protein [Bradyrhizobium sp.]
MRVFYFCMGWVLVALGAIGAVTPLLPTTIFLIGAAGCFARSSPRLEAWLLNHPQFGKTLRDWRSDGAISRPGKMMACAGMTFGFVAFWFSAHPSLWLAAGVAGLLLACATYVVSRPTIVDQP